MVFLIWVFGVSVFRGPLIILPAEDSVVSCHSLCMDLNIGLSVARHYYDESLQAVILDHSPQTRFPSPAVQSSERNDGSDPNQSQKTSKGHGYQPLSLRDPASW